MHFRKIEKGETASFAGTMDDPSTLLCCLQASLNMSRCDSDIENISKGGRTSSNAARRGARRKRSHWLVGTLGIVLSHFRIVAAVGPFATENGYDNEGGTDPICWDSRVFWNETEDASNHPSRKVMLNQNFDVLNNRTFAESEEVTQLDIRKNCFRGTDLRIDPNIEDFSGRLLTGRPHSFRFELQVVPSAVVLDGALSKTSNGTAWFRLLLCDAVKTGFCSPFVGTAGPQPSENTDVDEPIMVESSSWDVDAYGYTNNRTLIGVKEGFHVFTRYARWDLQEEEPGSGVFSAILDMEIVLPIDMAGFYFFIGHAIVFIDSPHIDSTIQLRVDVADAVPDNVIEFREPADIKVITEGFKIGAGIVIGVFLLAELYAFFFIIRHRKHPVMRLAQAPFLAMLMGCVIMITGCSFVFMPTQDIFCNLRGLLVEVPLSMVAAIMVGRIWRAYSTLSSALRIGSNKQEKSRPEKWIMTPLTAIARFPTSSKQQEDNGLPRRTGLRQKVSAVELVRLIVFLVLPQLVVQVVGVSLYQRNLIVDLTENGRTGRQICDTSSRWPTYVGMVFVGLLFLLAVLLAWVARDLPSAMNEKTGIFHSSAFNSVLAFVALSLIFIADSPSTSPNVSAFLWIAMILGIVLSTTAMIVLPKVRRVRSGEKVVISNLLIPGTGVSRRSSLDVIRASITSSDMSRQHHPGELGEPEQRLSTLFEADDSATLDHAVVDISAVSSTPTYEKKHVYLDMNEPPPRRVEGEMFALKDICSAITEKSLEGHQILLKDWKSLKKSVSNLHDDLDRIELTWSAEDEESLFVDGKGPDRRP